MGDAPRPRFRHCGERELCSLVENVRRDGIPFAFRVCEPLASKWRCQTNTAPVGEALTFQRLSTSDTEYRDRGTNCKRFPSPCSDVTRRSTDQFNRMSCLSIHPTVRMVCPLLSRSRIAAPRRAVQPTTPANGVRAGDGSVRNIGGPNCRNLRRMNLSGTARIRQRLMNTLRISTRTAMTTLPAASSC